MTANSLDLLAGPNLGTGERRHTRSANYWKFYLDFINSTLHESFGYSDLYNRDRTEWTLGLRKILFPI